MKYYLDEKEVTLDQLNQHLEELYNQEAYCDDIYWKAVLIDIKDGNLYFETMRFENC